MSEKTKSITGENSTEVNDGKRASWAEKQANKNEARVQVWREKGYKTKVQGNEVSLTVGSSMIQSYSDYQDAISGAEETNPAPEWQSLNLSQFVAEDLQKAFNQIKTMADTIIATAEMVSSYANLASRALSTYASLVETLINTIRNEIKDILDNLLGLGGVYVLRIPVTKGGVDKFKQVFYNSLSDTSDPSRPQFLDTTSAHALFFMAGATDFSIYLQNFEKFLKFFTPTEEIDVSPVSFPGITNLSVKAIRAPVLSLTKKDSLYAMSDSNKQDVYTETVINPETGKTETKTTKDYLGFLRSVESYVSLSEKSQAFQGFCSWDVDDSASETYGSTKASIGLTLLSKSKQTIFVDTKPFYFTESFSRQNVPHWSGTGPEATEFVVRMHMPTDWLMVRSTNANFVNNFTWDDKEAIALVKERQGLLFAAVRGAEKVLVEEDGSAIYCGKLVPGFNFFSDTLVVDPTQPSNAKKIAGIPMAPEDLSQVIYYKMMTWGRSIALKVRFDPTGDGKYEVRVSKFDEWKKDKGKPYSDTPDTITKIDDLSMFSSYDIFKHLHQTAEPIFETEYNMGTDSDPDYWSHSNFSQVVAVSNEPILMPGYGPAPNWYSVKGNELLPPLKKFIDKAKAYVDYLADSLIESLNGLLAYVQSILDWIDLQTRKIKELMDLIKSMLIPPLAGVHFMSLSTKQGMKGIKAQFEASFSGAPQISIGQYPEEYTKYGRRMITGSQALRALDVKDHKSGQDLNEEPPTEESGDPGTWSKKKEAAMAKKYSNYEKDFNDALAAKPNTRRKSISEPDEDTQRRLGIPIYDSNCYTTGLVLVCESITAVSALTRLLNLEAFVNKEIDTMKRSYAGYREFTKLALPSIWKQKIETWWEQQKAKRDRFIWGRPEGEDSDAVNANVNKKKSDGKKQDNEKEIPSLQNPEGGNAAILGAEPFCGPQYKLSISGIPVTIELESCISADELASLINLKLTDILVKLGLKNAKKWGKIAVSVDGNLVVQTPHSSVGDGSQKVKVVDGSASFGIADGNSIIKADDALEFKEKVFPVKDGDLVAQVVETGAPTQDMLFKSQAIFEYGSFVSDPDLQNFAPDRCKLLMAIDDQPMRSIDVTGNLGSNSVDSTPTVTLPSETEDFTFPLTITGDHGKFLVEIDGNFLLGSNIPTTSVDRYDTQTVTAAVDFVSMGVRAGDDIVLTKTGETPESSVIEKVETNKLTLRHIISWDADVVIGRISRGGVPSQLITNLHPLISREVDLLHGLTKTYDTLGALAQDIQSAMIAAGISSQIFDISSDDGTTGKIRIALRAPWAYGPSVSLSIKKVSYTSDSALITIPSPDIHAGVFPLTVDSVNNQIRFRILGYSGVSESYTTITIPSGVYADVVALTTAIQTQLTSLNYPVICASLGGSIKFSIDDHGQASHWSHSPNVVLEVKHLVPNSETKTYSEWKDSEGVRRPPVLKISGLSFPFKVADGYCQKLQVKITPNIQGRPSGWVEVNLIPGTYSSISGLASSVLQALREAGFVSGDTGYLRVDSENADTLVLSLRPEKDYCSPASTLYFQNGRSSEPTRTGASVTTMSLRDYDYEQIFAWLALNPTLNSPIGFPNPAPKIFTAQLPVYSGALVINSTNDKFRIKITTPVQSPSVSGEWQTVEIGEVTYTSLADFVTAIQTSIDAIYGSGIVTVSSTGDDQLKFEIAHADLKGEFTQIELSQFGGQKFACWGNATLGAILGETTDGIGDRYFCEVLGLSANSSSGRFDLCYQAGILNDSDPTDADGVKYKTAAGSADHDFLGILGVADTAATGTLKEPYALSTVIDQINASFSSYHTVASTFEDTGTLRVEGKLQSSKGKVQIVAVEDPAIPGSKESGEVADLLFDFAERRQDQIIVSGVGQEMLSFMFVADLGRELEQIVDIHNGFAWETVSLENDKIIETIGDANRNWIAEIILLEN